MTSFVSFFANRDAQFKNEGKKLRSKSRRGEGGIKPRKLMTEVLEERQLLAVGVWEGSSAAVADTANIINITSTAISVDSIRQAIAEAASTPDDDIIRLDFASLQFSSSDDEITIDVDSSVCGSITIVGVNDNVTIDANSFSRIFSVKNGDVFLENLTLVNGSSEFGGALANSGNLTLLDVTLRGNSATIGGAIANCGTLNIQDSVIINNTSTHEGGAIYEGEFQWPVVEAPEWNAIPDLVGSKGTVESINLADYINIGTWTYSYSIADSTSVILASSPELSDSGILSFSFIGDSEYYGEDDYSTISVTVTATDGTLSDSVTFSVSLAEQTSVTIAAILSNMSYDDAVDEYLQGSPRRPTGYAADEIPSPAVVDVSKTTTVQVWMQDFDWTDYDKKIWDAGDYIIMGVEYRIHLDNATVVNFTERTGLCRSAYVYKELDNGDYEFIIAYTSGANFGYEEALLLDVLTIEAVDPNQPVSATVYQINRDWTYPCYTRLYQTPTPRDPARSHINVDPSQTLFVSTISNSITPLSATPGQSFNLNISRPERNVTDPNFSGANLSTTRNTSVTISNSVIAKNVSEGDGAIYIADYGVANLVNTTVADNSASGAAVFIAESSNNSVRIVNSIIVNASVNPISGNATVLGSLVNDAVLGATTYRGGSLFVDATNNDYSLAVRSEAINLGVDDEAVNYAGVGLTTDLGGFPRMVNGVDAGAYEYQGVAPFEPAGLSVTDYLESNKNPVLTWNAPTLSQVDGYYVYLIEGEARTLLATLGSEQTSFEELSTTAMIADNNSYILGVVAFNAFGVSSMPTTTLDTYLPPEAPTNLLIGDYSNGSVELSWSQAEGALSYNVESLNELGEWSVIANTTNLSISVSGLEDFVSYSLRVVAINKGGIAASEPLAFTTITNPDAPTGLKWTGEYLGNGTMTLVWDAVEFANGYVVYQKVGEEWNRVATTDEPSYTFTQLSDNSTYEFRVSAYAEYNDNIYYSEPSSILLKTTIAPSAPETVGIVGEYDGSGTVQLSWSSVDNAYAYSIAQLVDGKWEEVHRTFSTTYSVTGLNNNNEYVIGVAAYNLADSTRYYSDYTCLNLNTIVAPSTPTGVHFAEYGGGDSATLLWNAVEGATGYLIEKLNDANLWETVTTTNELTYTTTVEPDSYYSYRISAFTTVGNEIRYSATTTVNLDTLTVPSGELIVDVKDYLPADGTATVFWNELENAESYSLYVRVGVGDWILRETIAGSTSFVVTGLEVNTEYGFRVVAANSVGNGSSGVKTFFTAVAPKAPTDLVFNNQENGLLVLTWSAVDYATGYIVESYDGLTQTWKVETREDDSLTSHSITGIEEIGVYTFRVSAYNISGTSQPTTIVYDNSGAPQSPTNVSSIFYAGSRTVDLSWDLVKGATGYYVYQLDNENSSWNRIGNLSSISNVYIISNVEKNTEYTFAVTAYNSNGESDLATIVVSTLTAPNAPTNVSFGEPDNTVLGSTLSWTSSEGAEGYLVERKDGEEWTTVATLDQSTTSWSVSGLEEATSYTFRVSAFNDAGSSEPVEVTLTTGVALPEAPTEFIISNYNAETRRATMSWADNATNETGYEVQYSYDEVEWITAATLPADSTSRVASGLTPGKTYYFRVASFNESGRSEWVTSSFAVPSTSIEAPTNLVFDNYDSSAKTLLLSWNDNSDNEAGFRVQYSLNQSDWYTVATTDANETSYSAKGLVAGRTYFFRVAAYDLYGVSEWTTGSFDVPVIQGNVPTAPSDILFSEPVFTSKGVDVTMSWTDNSENETRFVIQFSYDNMNWYGAGTTGENVTTRVATGLVEGRTYYFRVAAYNDFGYSDWASETYVVPSSTVNSPSNIVFGEYSNGSVSMSWTDNSENELGFVVQYSYDGVNWHRGGTTAANVTTRVASKMTPGRLYYFRVAAYNSNGYSDWTLGQFMTPSGAPLAPNNLVFSDYSESNHTVVMKWDDVSADETGFNIQYSIDGGNTWHNSGSTSTDVNYRTATGLRVGVTYEFRVRAFNSFGSSGWTYGSFVVPASENAPAAPTDFTFGDYDFDSKTLAMSWTDNASNEIGYKAQYSVDGGSTWYSAGSYGANVTSRVATGLTAGRTYLFRVAAYNADGASPWLISEPYDVSVSVYIPAAPSAVTFGEYDSENRSVVMSWTDNAVNEKGFKVEYSVDGGQTWIASAYLAANTTSREASGLVAGRSYDFRVAAYNNYGYSDWAIGSYSVIATEEILAPRDIAFTYSSTKRTLVLDWFGETTNYNVQYRPITSTVWYTLEPTGKKASLSGAVYGSAFYFRIQSVAEDGSVSEWTQVSYDTRTGTSIESEAVFDVLEEAFKDYFEEFI